LSISFGLRVGKLRRCEDKSMGPVVFGARSRVRIKLALGDLADRVLADQRVIPAFEKCGCQFRYRALETALEACQPL